MPSFSSHSQSDDSEREDHAMAAQISALSEQVPTECMHIIQQIVHSVMLMNLTILPTDNYTLQGPMCFPLIFCHNCQILRCMCTLVDLHIKLCMNHTVLISLPSLLPSMAVSPSLYGCVSFPVSPSLYGCVEPAVGGPVEGYGAGEGETEGDAEWREESGRR